MRLDLNTESVQCREEGLGNTSPDDQKISEGQGFCTLRSSGDVFPIHPSSQECTAVLSALHSMQGNIDSSMATDESWSLFFV